MADYNWLAQQRAARMPSYMAGNQKGPSALDQAVGPIATALGAGVGFIMGGPPGALAGAQIGSSAAGVGKDIAHGRPVSGDLLQAASAFAPPPVPSTPISPLGGGTQPMLPMPGLPLIGMATGGMVPDLSQFLPQPQQQDPYANATPGSLAGPAPTPTPQLQPGHPTWELLAQLIPQIVNQLPGPNPKNTGTVGSRYLPALATAVTGPTNIMRMQREKKNADIQKQNEAEAQAYRQRVTDAARSLAQHRYSQMFQKDSPQSASAMPYMVNEDEAKRLGHPEWANTEQPMGRVEQARRLMPQVEKQSPTMKVFGEKTKQAADIARRIKLGLADPRMTGFRDMKPYVEAQLGDFNTAQAVAAYEATLSFVKQRESRLTQQQRNSMRAVQKQFALLNNYNEKYTEAAKGLRTSMQVPNASVLWMGENGLLGKDAQRLSRQLKGQTMLMADQIANIFMAGGVPTDQSLKMAREVLDASWSQDQIASNSDMVLADIAGRLAALYESSPMVKSPYMPETKQPGAGGNAQDLMDEFKQRQKERGNGR